MLLQILEDGVLTDAQGRKVDFKNTVIVMTSNVGARSITDNKRLGFASDEAETLDASEIKSNVMNELKRSFRPEFLNRIDEIIVFHQLDREDIKKITAQMLKTTEERVKQLDATLRCTDRAMEKLAELGFDPVYGARPLRRVIQLKVEDQIAEAFLEGKMKPGSEIVVDTTDEKEIAITAQK